jgi:hypothetical protein
MCKFNRVVDGSLAGRGASTEATGTAPYERESSFPPLPPQSRPSTGEAHNRRVHAVLGRPQVRTLVVAKWGRRKREPAVVTRFSIGGFADGGGGVAIIEADSAATLARTTAPWTPWLRFAATPIVPIEETTGIVGEAAAFRDSVS